jgi:hypothetical protein
MGKNVTQWTAVGPIRAIPPTRFESEEEVMELQRELLAILKRTGVHDRLHKRLSDCRLHHCGADKCIEACWFGARRRRLREIPRAYRLMQQTKGPIFEIRISRAAWAKPIGQLRLANITWTKQFLRRAFDSLYRPNIVALGTFKVSVVCDVEGAYWRCEMHHLVAGLNKGEWQEVFPEERAHGQFDAIATHIMPVSNLGQSVSRVLRRNLEIWQNPWYPDPNQRLPHKTERIEFNNWLLDLRIGARLFRYGCDASFNRLNMQPRERPPLKPRRRTYPHWLEPFMFGGPYWDSKNNNK